MALSSAAWTSVWHSGHAVAPSTRECPHWGHSRITDGVNVDKENLHRYISDALRRQRIRTIHLKWPGCRHSVSDAQADKKYHQADDPVQWVAQCQEGRSKPDE